MEALQEAQAAAERLKKDMPDATGGRDNKTEVQRSAAVEKTSAAGGVGTGVQVQELEGIYDSRSGARGVWVRHRVESVEVVQCAVVTGC